jgi:proline-specific peptidase
MILARRDLFRAAGCLTLGLAGPAWARGLASIPTPTRERMVSVRGGHIYVRVNGDLGGSLPPIIGIHGGPGGTHAALTELLALASDRAVILYDQLGSGRSDRPTDSRLWTVPRFVDELDAIQAALGVDRWHVLGQSWGGTVALEYGARRRAALRGLMLVSPLVSTHSWIADANALRAKLPAAVQDQLKVCDDPAVSVARCDEATAPFYAAYLTREAPTPAHRAYEHFIDAAGGFNPDLYKYMWGASEFVSTGTLRDYDGEPLLDRLDGKHTLFMVGQYDEARPATALRFADHVPGCEVAVLAGAGHSTFGDRPDEAIAILRGWLSRQDALPA